MSPSARTLLELLKAKIASQKEGRPISSEQERQLTDLANMLGLSDKEVALLYEQALKEVWLEMSQRVQELSDERKALEGKVSQVLKQSSKTSGSSGQLSALNSQIADVASLVNNLKNALKRPPRLRASSETGVSKTAGQGCDSGSGPSPRDDGSSLAQDDKKGRSRRGMSWRQIA